MANGAWEWGSEEWWNEQWKQPPWQRWQWFRQKPVPEPTTAPSPAPITMEEMIVPGELWRGSDKQYYDLDGNVVPYDRVQRMHQTYLERERVRTGFLTPTEQLAREQWEWQKQRAAQAPTLATLAEAQQRMQQGMGEQEWLQMQSALLELLGDISAHPRNWIQAHFANQILGRLQWMMQQRGAKRAKIVIAGSPGEASAQGATGWVPPEAVGEALAQQTRAYESAPTIYPQPTLQSATERAAAAMDGGYATGRGAGGAGPPEVGRPPLTPKWLAAIVPSLTVGKPIAKGEVTPPSGQSWSRMDWTRQQELAGYLDWARGEGAFQNLQEYIAKSIPRQPALGRRWTPPSQFA